MRLTTQEVYGVCGCMTDKNSTGVTELDNTISLLKRSDQENLVNNLVSRLSNGQCESVGCDSRSLKRSCSSVSSTCYSHLNVLQSFGHSGSASVCAKKSDTFDLGVIADGFCSAVYPFCGFSSKPATTVTVTKDHTHTSTVTKSAQTEHAKSTVTIVHTDTVTKTTGASSHKASTVTVTGTTTKTVHVSSAAKTSTVTITHTTTKSASGSAIGAGSTATVVTSVVSTTTAYAQYTNVVSDGGFESYSGWTYNSAELVEGTAGAPAHEGDNAG
jgi:hypothetical protein